MATFLKRIFIGCLLIPTLGFAKDWGCCGHTFPIQEEDILEYLTRKLSSLSNQEREEIEIQFKKNVQRSIENPTPVDGLSNAIQYRVFYYDPTFILKTDIEDENGGIIIKKGTSFNPLKQFYLDNDFIFFDGTNASHIAWAKQQAPGSHWILVKGSPLKLEEIENRPVFFDQKGVLREKLGFENIPVRVSQEALKLKIEEIPVKL